MFNALFPASTNNVYRGNRLALVVLALLAALKLLIGVRSALDPAAVAQGADGIPIDKFPPAAANEVLNMFGLLGINNVIIAALCFIVLWRYRALVPLMFGVQLAGRGMHWAVST